MFCVYRKVSKTILFSIHKVSNLVWFEIITILECAQLFNLFYTLNLNTSANVCCTKTVKSSAHLWLWICFYQSKQEVLRMGIYFSRLKTQLWLTPLRLAPGSRHPPPLNLVVPLRHFQVWFGGWRGPQLPSVWFQGRHQCRRNSPAGPPPRSLPRLLQEEKQLRVKMCWQCEKVWKFWCSSVKQMWLNWFKTFQRFDRGHRHGWSYLLRLQRWRPERSEAEPRQCHRKEKKHRCGRHSPWWLQTLIWILNEQQHIFLLPSISNMKTWNHWNKLLKDIFTIFQSRVNIKVNYPQGETLKLRGKTTQDNYFHKINTK